MIRNASVPLLAALSVALAGCLDPLREGPTLPAEPSAGAVVLGAVSTTTGAAVAGAAGEIDVYRESTDEYVGGETFTTDGMGEFAKLVFLAYVGRFQASVRIVIVPPTGLGLLPDTVTGRVPFTPGVSDTLRVSVTLRGP